MQQDEEKEEENSGPDQKKKLDGGHLSDQLKLNVLLVWFTLRVLQYIQYVWAHVECAFTQVIVWMSACVCGVEIETTRVKDNQSLSTDRSHYIISAWVTNNTDSVSTLSLKKTGQHVQGEFLHFIKP